MRPVMVKTIFHPSL